jgi:hypothetical protein
LIAPFAIKQGLGCWSLLANEATARLLYKMLLATTRANWHTRS